MQQFTDNQPQLTNVLFYLNNTLTVLTLGAARSSWTVFEKYVFFQTRQGSINTFDEFKNVFALTLLDIA